MFLSDQQKAIKGQDTDKRLLDLAANAIKEWDDAVSLRDEYTAKFLEESEKSDPHIEESSIISQSQSGKVQYKNDCEFAYVFNSLSHQYCQKMYIHFGERKPGNKSRKKNQNYQMTT